LLLQIEYVKSNGVDSLDIVAEVDQFSPAIRIKAKNESSAAVDTILIFLCDLRPAKYPIVVLRRIRVVYTVIEVFGHH
jgi:hypothetical protein